MLLLAVLQDVVEEAAQNGLVWCNCRYSPPVPPRSRFLKAHVQILNSSRRSVFQILNIIPTIYNTAKMVNITEKIKE